MVRALEHVLVGKALEVFMPPSANDKVGAGLAALSCFLAIISIGLAIYSAFLWAQARYPVDLAMGFTALVALGFALLIALFYGLMVFFQRWRIQKLRQEIHKALAETFDTLEEEWGEAAIQWDRAVRDNPKMAVAMASLSGFLLGENIR